LLSLGIRNNLTERKEDKIHLIVLISCAIKGELTRIRPAMPLTIREESPIMLKLQFKRRTLGVALITPRRHASPSARLLEPPMNEWESPSFPIGETMKTPQPARGGHPAWEPSKKRETSLKGGENMLTSEKGKVQEEDRKDEGILMGKTGAK